MRPTFLGFEASKTALFASQKALDITGNNLANINSIGYTRQRVDQVSVNYTWFSEKFKEHTGVNFNEYLKKMRLDEAKRLLQKDCYKVYEVAERSGFSDVKYFMKQFREETGMSPTEWANKHKTV